MTQILLAIVQESWSILGEMSPYLLFGFLVAGILSVCISPEFVQRHLGGHGFAPVLKAALLGVPLPLCSCGVIPVSASFRRHGASKAAVTSFLLSTPQTGIDSIAITYALLGLTFAAFRPFAALATGLFGGLLVLWFGQANHETNDAAANQQTCTESCCTGHASGGVIRRALTHGLVTLPRDIGLPLLLGVVIAGCISALVPQNQWQPFLGGGVVSILLMMALGIPLYVCASASVPIAAGLIHIGASPGAALAFLIAGPGTNAATITTIWKLLGRRTAALYLLTIALSAVASGLLLDWLMTATHATVPFETEHLHTTMGGIWATSLWAIVLLAVVAYSYAAKPNEEHIHEQEDANVDPEEATEHIVLAIKGMNCSHCTTSVHDALAACPGVVSAGVHLASGRAEVVGNHLNIEVLLAAVRSAGFEANTITP